MVRFFAEGTGVSKGEAAAGAIIIVLDEWIDDEKALRMKTGVEPKNFHLLAGALSRYMEKDPGSALYWGKPGSEGGAGRRCALAPRHALFMYLEYVRHGASQDSVAATYRISQSSASRYFEYVEKALSELLPTGDNMAGRIMGARTADGVQRAAAGALAGLEEAAGAEPGSAGRPGKTLPRGTVVHDGTHVPRERAKDREERDASYSGKKKAYTNNVVLTTNRNGLIIGVSGYAPGSTHDLTLLRESGAGPGLVTRCMEGRSSAMRVVELVDRGFRGLERHHPGSSVRMPLARRDSRTPAARRRNRLVNAARVVIEHTIRRCKTNARLRHRVRRTMGKARRAFNVVTGLVNLHLLTRSPDRSRSHRKHKKPGPKTARSR